MYTVDLYRRVRRAHFVEGMSVREVARKFDLQRCWNTRCHPATSAIMPHADRS
ncbi:MAG: hypothetical protein J4O03_14275 [Chloroflexi bacterium]|nr:hypothetical protein [Chloroflexota bacterium]MCI0781121.1 hypothetical protein [Chloroflexota bacterium]MCI0787346.1 hypothetical protein [Chloroflexota bacterium]MCI0794625.1 hypothetical protein [Chloroflexota bacterium]MCI0895826.1 hypothetical protein [Chloroflexota bacterium]